MRVKTDIFVAYPYVLRWWLIDGFLLRVTESFEADEIISLAIEHAADSD